LQQVLTETAVDRCSLNYMVLKVQQKQIMKYRILTYGIKGIRPCNTNYHICNMINNATIKELNMDDTMFSALFT